MIKQTFNKIQSLPPEGRLAVYGVGGFLLYKLYNAIFLNAQQQTNQAIINQATKEETELQKKYKPTFPISNYLTFANQIYEATKYGIGDNYNQVVEIASKLKNDLDVAILIKLYGARQNYVFGIPQGEPRDLFTNIREELGSEYGGLSSAKLDKINLMWAKKGIHYKL